MARLWTAQRLERGAWRGPLARGTARIWRRVADPIRPVCLPPQSDVIGVGGATLGGSGKTPTVLELARALAEREVRVAVVASGYRVHVCGARVVRPDDDARVVGDEALLLARALHDHGVATVVGAKRQPAIDLAAELGTTVVVDGLLQTRPRRLTRSVLVIDADAPLGSGRCPPAGDLKADPARLLRAADMVVTIRDSGARGESEAARAASDEGPAACTVTSDVRGALTAQGDSIPVADLRRRRLGLVLAIARPERVLRALARRGIVPTTAEFFPDHGSPGRSPSRGWMHVGGSGPRIDAWLTTAKCATKLAENYRGAPVWTLDHRLRLPARLVDFCAPG